MPAEPPPSRYDLPPPVPGDGDVIAVGGDLEPGTILQAYRKGLFPMGLPDGHLGWWSPVERAILPIAGLHISRSLRQSCRRYAVTVNEDFEGVIRGCADPSRESGWISQDFIDAYTVLHRLGWAHSIEVWDIDDSLAGGLYGVSIGGLFAGESMFHRKRDASKVALVELVVVMGEGGGSLIDIQWLTPHLEAMGGVIIGREKYLERLEAALGHPGPFSGPRPVPPG